MSVLREIAHTNRNREVEAKKLRERMEARLTAGFDGGMWEITPNFIGFLHGISSQYQKTVIKDCFGIPREVNVPDLLKFVTTRHHEIMNEWYNEYEKQSRKR